MPLELHQRVPLVIGSKKDVAYAASILGRERVPA
jgi:fructose-1,6-bisphosphatase